MLVNLLTPGTDFPAFYLKIIHEAGESIYECQRVENFPANRYCTGQEMRAGEILQFLLISEREETLLAEGNFAIVGLALPTPQDQATVSPTATVTGEQPLETITAIPTPEQPILPSYHWDGDQRFLFNSFKRNDAYGELYLYDMSTVTATKINPVNGVCCYGSAVLSPDGTYILFVFQDVRRGADSITQLYYIPLEPDAGETTFTPIPLPIQFFPNQSEDIELALRHAVP